MRIDNQLTKDQFLSLNDCYLRTLSIVTDFPLYLLKAKFANNYDITFSKLNQLFNGKLKINNVALCQLKDFDFNSKYHNKSVAVSIFPTAEQFKVLQKYINKFDEEFSKVWNSFSYEQLFNELKSKSKYNSFHWIAVRNQNYFDYMDYLDFGININDWYILSIITYN